MPKFMRDSRPTPSKWSMWVVSGHPRCHNVPTMVGSLHACERLSFCKLVQAASPPWEPGGETLRGCGPSRSAPRELRSCVQLNRVFLPRGGCRGSLASRKKPLVLSPSEHIEKSFRASSLPRHTAMLLWSPVKCLGWTRAQRVHSARQVVGVRPHAQPSGKGSVSRGCGDKVSWSRETYSPWSEVMGSAGGEAGRETCVGLCPTIWGRLASLLFLGL